ncbi:MAG: hypothetical protein AB7E28_03070 [Desulfurella sp.]|jgi:hypothetical protein
MSRNLQFKDFLLFLLIVALSTLSFVKKARAIPSFSRQTGLSCDVCHTVFPHLTPFGRDFKLHGYTYDYSKLIKFSRNQYKQQAKEEGFLPNLAVNQIPMLSLRVKSQYSHMKGGSNVPSKTKFNWVKGSSLYFAGEIAPNIGTFTELTGINDEGGSLTLGGFDLALVSPNEKLGPYNLTFGLRGEDMVGFSDPTNSVGNWGALLHGFSGGISSRNRFFEAFAPSPLEGGEIYAMLGGFTHGGLYAAFGLYHPTSGQVGKTSPSYVALTDPGSGSATFDGTSNVDEYGRLAYFFPEFDHIYTEIGTFGYFGHENITASEAPGNGEYSDAVREYGIDGQLQYIDSHNLFEIFASFIHDRNGSFYGHDIYNGQLINGSAVAANNFSINADYYYNRTYGIYAKYTYQHSSELKDLNVSGEAIGLSWYPYQNVNLRLEEDVYNKDNPDVAASGGSASDYDTTRVMLQYAF